MATPKLKIAIIGTGVIGPRHAKSVLKNPSCTLRAIVDPLPQTSQLALFLNTTHYTSLTSLLSSPHKPDAAIVCTPNNTHVPISLQLIEAGIHVLVEKPIATTIEDGRRLMEAAKRKGVRVLVGHHRRFNPYLLSAKKTIEGNVLGKIVAIQGTWCLKKNPGYFDGVGEWRRGAGAVLINLIHEMDLLQYLFGKVVLVSALETSKSRAFEAEEGAAILLRFEIGVVGTFLLSDNTPSPWNFEGGTGENPAIPRVGKEQAAGGFYRVLGTEASLSVPDLTVWKGDWEHGKGREEVGVDEGIVPFDEQVEHFVKVVRGQEEPSCSAEEGLRAMVVCAGVKRAIERGDGMPVRIEGFEIKEVGGGRLKL